MAKKRRTIDIIGAFVIALGVAMLLYPTISNMITKMRAAREITAYGVFADDGRYTKERALADRYNRAVMSGSPRATAGRRSASFSTRLTAICSGTSRYRQ